MAIDLKNIMVGNADDERTNNDRVKSSDLIWDNVDDGTYAATMVIVYPWKEYTKDQYVRVRDDEGKFVRDADGNFETTLVKDLKWHMTDVVFRIDGGEFDNHAVKYLLSTHPNFVGSAKQFLYRMGIFGVSLDDLYKHTGKTGFVVVKNRDNNYVDKDTGLTVETVESYVSYIAEADSETDIGI